MRMSKSKLIRITTVPISLDKLLSGQLNFMSQFYRVTGVSSEPEYLRIVGVKEKIEVHHVEMTRQITPVKDLQSVYQLYLFFKKEKPLIVHSHTPKAGTVGMLAAKLAGVPNRLHTVAGLPLMEAKGAKRRLLNLVEKLTYLCATKVYPNSFGLEKIIIGEKFCASKKLKVIGQGSTNGINTGHFNSSNISQEEKDKLIEELKISAADFVFTFVGRLVSDKGINELVAAFKGVQLEFPNAKLLLVGPLETKLDPLFPATLEEIDSNDAIINVGYQNDVRPYFAISDALVFPSYREGFPNVVMQAGAMGLPSIVSDINGCNEIIIDSFNGLIIPVKNSDAIYAAMKRIVEDKNLYQNLQQNARKRIVDNYEQSVVWEAILAEYKSLENNV